MIIPFWEAYLAKMLFSGSLKNTASAREQSTLGSVSFSTSINCSFQHSLLLYITPPCTEPSLMCSTGVTIQLPGFVQSQVISPRLTSSGNTK